MLTGAVDAGLGRRLVVELTEHEQVEDYDVCSAATQRRAVTRGAAGRGRHRLRLRELQHVHAAAA
jgi:hypothetical protein